MSLKIYIDTNIYINSILNRDNRVSQKILIFLENTKTKVFINDISILNINYILRKYLDKPSIKNELKAINDKNVLVSVDKTIINQALNSKFNDFEDGIQYFCAKQINADLILTDNKKDFANSQIKIMSSKEFFEKFINN